MCLRLSKRGMRHIQVKVSTLADISKELEALKAWNKPVLGAVVVGVDAVM